jgi:hypothetical protein
MPLSLYRPPWRLHASIACRFLMPLSLCLYASMPLLYASIPLPLCRPHASIACRLLVSLSLYCPPSLPPFLTRPPSRPPSLPPSLFHSLPSSLPTCKHVPSYLYMCVLISLDVFSYLYVSSYRWHDKCGQHIYKHIQNTPG